LLFLYREVLGIELPWLDNIENAQVPRRLPVVLTENEVRAVPSHLDGMAGLMARLFYGIGMRVMECLRLRAKGTDFSCGEIMVREGERLQRPGDAAAGDFDAGIAKSTCRNQVPPRNRSEGGIWRRVSSICAGIRSRAHRRVSAACGPCSEHGSHPYNGKGL